MIVLRLIIKYSSQIGNMNILDFLNKNVNNTQDIEFHSTFFGIVVNLRFLNAIMLKPYEIDYVLYEILYILRRILRLHVSKMKEFYKKVMVHFQ